MPAIRSLTIATTLIVATAAHAAPAATASAAEPLIAAGLKCELPQTWVPEPPASSMRLAQGTIPGKAGAAQYGLFFFGKGGGGSADDNINRWLGQIESPPTAPNRGVLMAHGLHVTWVETAGTLKPSTIGMGPSTPQPGSRLIGAVIEGPGGPWFFKVIGPDATVTAAREAFFTMLRGMAPAPDSPTGQP
jgi:hypothetical protein